MTETSVERVVRNKLSTVISIFFLLLLVGIMIKDFYLIFHEGKATIYQKMLPGLQLVGAFIALLWLFLLMLVSSMSMSGPSFKKSCPYTVTFLIVMAFELVPAIIWDSTGWKRTGLIALTIFIAVLVLLQMLAFSLDPHSSSIFVNFRPFRIEVLTVIQLSAQAPSVKRSERASIV